MKARFSGTVATCALIVCVVCHIWACIVIVQEFMYGGISDIRGGISLPLVLLYMVSVCLFNWYAVTSASQGYRRMALVVTIAHLAGALLQGAAAEALLSTGARSESWIMIYGITLPAMLNLPMNSTQVIHDLPSLLPWLTAGFYALNLAVVAVRTHRIAETV